VSDTQKQAVLDSLRSHLDRIHQVLRLIEHKSELAQREREQVDLLILELKTQVELERGKVCSRSYDPNEYEEKYLKPNLKTADLAAQACWGAFGPHWAKTLDDARGELTYSVLNLTAL
jgi:hypothetical protein